MICESESRLQCESRTVYAGNMQGNWCCRRMLTLHKAHCLEHFHRIWLVGNKYNFKHFEAFQECFSTTSNPATDNVKNGDSPENSFKSKDDCKSHEDDVSLKKDFVARRLRGGRRQLSPTARLQSILPKEFTETLIDDSTTEPRQDIANDTNDAKKATVRNGSLGNSQSLTPAYSSEEVYKVRRRSSVLPSRRISNLIPKEYWDALQDSETKQIVDDLGENKTETESSSDEKETK